MAQNVSSEKRQQFRPFPQVDLSMALPGVLK